LKASARALEHGDFGVRKTYEIAAMIGGYDIVHIVAAEAGALIGMKLVEVSRNSATNGFGNVEHSERACLFSRHGNFLIQILETDSSSAYEAIFRPP
jgi:hypothetical protein